MRVIFHIDLIATGNQLKRIMIMTTVAAAAASSMRRQKNERKYAKNIKEFTEIRLHSILKHNSFSIFQFPLFMEIYDC